MNIMIKVLSIYQGEGEGDEDKDEFISNRSPTLVIPSYVILHQQMLDTHVS